MTALIWDLDGTLLDSYGIILNCVLAALREEGIVRDPSETYGQLIAGSVKSFFGNFAAAGLDPDRLWERYRALSTARDGEVRLMDGAREALEALSGRGIPQFVYTHKGESAPLVLERLGVLRYFADVLTAGAGLPRKPAPDGLNALCARHNLDKSHTYYIGDRPIDVRCAANAGVKSILFRPPASPAVPTGDETYIVADLREISKMKL